MAIENIDIIQFEPFEALVQAGKEILPCAPFAIRPRPHAVASLRRNNQFISIGTKVLAKYFPKVLFCRTGWRTVVIGKVKMRNAEIKGAPDHGTRSFQGIDTAEVMPQPQRNRRQQ